MTEMVLHGAVNLVSESMIQTTYTVANADVNYMPETGTMANDLW